MATKAEVLIMYNTLHGTNYGTVAELAADLATQALRETLIAQKINEAHEAAAIEAIT